jgi:hypothetical protein
MKIFNKIKKIFKKNNNQELFLLNELKRTIESNKKVYITEELLDQYNIWKYLIVNYNIKYNELAATFEIAKNERLQKEVINDLSVIKDYTDKLIKKWETK